MIDYTTAKEYKPRWHYFGVFAYIVGVFIILAIFALALNTKTV